MSAGAAPPIAQVPSSSALRPVDPEKYIDFRLEETRRHVRAVDLTVALLKLCIGVLFCLLAVAVVDHWLVAGGLGKGSRFLLWGVLLLTGGWYAGRFLFPLLIHRINPVFAAQTIEQTRPSFKNGLINFLLLRHDPEAARRDELSRRVYQGLQTRTAAELRHVTVGTTVDRLHVIRLGYLLATLVAIGCLYFLVSPKNPLVSFGRVMLPWARIGTPTRVTIEAVAPGDVTAYQGDPLPVSAEVRGLRAGEPVSLYYSSVDGQSVDQSVPMSVPEGGFRYQGELPPGNLGLQQSLLYWIAAGDASTPKYRIEVQIPLSIVVDRVEYDYPAYTGLPRRVAVREGDLRAIEGTRATIQGVANYPIAQAFIELDGQSRPTVRMTADGSSATGRLTLAMSPADPTQPEYRWYQLRFTDPERRENRRPIRHRVEVIPDQKPEVRFVDPPPDELQLPVTGSLELKVHAEDPDFGLRRVLLRAESAGRGLMIPALLNKPRPAKPHQGPFEAAYRFEPARLSLKAGDKVSYWAEAFDCKEKPDDPVGVGSLAETEKRTILIVAGDPQRPAAKQGSPQKRQPGKQEDDRTEQPNREPQGAGDAEQKQPEKPEAQRPAAKESKSKPQQPGDNASPKEEPKADNQRQPGSDASNPPKPDADGEKSEDKSGQGADQKSRQRSTQKDKPQPGDSGENSPDNEQQGETDGNSGNQKSPGKAGNKDNPSGEKGQQSPAPAQGETDPGDAMERLLAHRQEEQAKEQAQRPGENQAQSDPRSQSQTPKDGESPDGTKPAGGQPTPAEKKPPSDPNSSQADPSAAAQDNTSEQKSGGKAGTKQPKAEGQKGAQRQQPSAADAGGQENTNDAAENDKAGTKGPDSKGAAAKARKGQKGGTDQTRSGESQAMEGDPGAEGQKSDSQKSDSTSKGAARQKGTAAKKSSEGQPADQDGEEKSAAKPENTQQETGKSPGAKRSKRSEASGKPEGTDSGEDGGESASKKAQADARKGSSKKSKGDGDSEASKADPEAKPAEQSVPGKKGGEPGAGDRPKAEKTRKAQKQPSTDAKQPSQQADAAEQAPGSDEKAKSAESMAGSEKENTDDRGGQPKGAQGAEPQSRPESAGAGEPSGAKASPSPQEANQQQGKNQAGDAAAKKPGDDPQATSPSISPKTSKSKGDSDGDKSGGGKTGGGQKAQQSGSGTPGSQTSADEGGQTSAQQGDGQTGTKAGQQAKSDQATGKLAMTKGEGKGSGTQKQTGGTDAAQQPPSGDPSQKNADGAKGGQPGQQPSAGEHPAQKGGSTSGNPTTGGQPGEAAQTNPPPAPPPPAPEDPNLEYARKQTSLALEHLADQLAKEKPEVLQRLGWDRAYAEKFLREWNEMRKAANQPGPQGEAAKREFDKALHSLGLRPPKAQLRKDQRAPDKVQQLQDTGRFPPPLEWTDYYRAYSQGVAESKD